MTCNDLERYATLVYRENSLRLRMQQLTEAARGLRDALGMIRAQRERVKAWVDSLPHAQRAIITARYLKGMDWQAVARETGYSLSQCHRLHRQAIQAVQGLEDA